MTQFGRSEICAYSPYGDACQGDSGGPVMFMRNGRFTVAAVVSHGYGCSAKGIPSVYGSVPPVRDWIRMHTGV